MKISIRQVMAELPADMWQKALQTSSWKKEF